MQYDKIQQVSEDTVLASHLASQKGVKMPQMPETVIYPFGLNQSQKLAVEQVFPSKISIIQDSPGTGKTQTILNIIANVVRSEKTVVVVVSNNNSATRNVAKKLEKKNAAFLTAFFDSLTNKEKLLDAQTDAYPNIPLLHLCTDDSGEKGKNPDCTKGRMIMPRIIRNAIRCKKCGDVIESKTVHDFKFCSCGSCAVDGGHDYLRRCGNRDDWEELSEAEKGEDNGSLS